MYYNRKRCTVPCNGRYYFESNLAHKNLSKSKNQPDPNVNAYMGFYHSQNTSKEFTKNVFFNKNFIVQNMYPHPERTSDDLRVAGNLRRKMSLNVQESPRSSNQPQRRVYVELKKYPGKIPDMELDETPCEYLNQFSSVFIDNIKDQIPKDPERKPRAYNNYVQYKLKGKPSDTGSFYIIRKRSGHDVNVMYDESDKVHHKNSHLHHSSSHRILNDCSKNNYRSKTQKHFLRFAPCCTPCCRPVCCIL